MSYLLVTLIKENKSFLISLRHWVTFVVMNTYVYVPCITWLESQGSGTSRATDFDVWQQPSTCGYCDEASNHEFGMESLYTCGVFFRTVTFQLLFVNSTSSFLIWLAVETNSSNTSLNQNRNRSFRMKYILHFQVVKSMLYLKFNC